jgi:hypothetical protein
LENILNVSTNSHILTDTVVVWFSCDFFSVVKPLNLLSSSIACDVSKGKSSYVFYCTFVLFQGDYGGPLVASNRLVGMYSWGVEGGLPQQPGAYIIVSALCDWIVINAGLYKISAVFSWMKTIPCLQKMPLTFIPNYLNN